MSEETDLLDKQDQGRRMDPELLVMGRMLRLLEELDEPAKGRVVRYLYDRWCKGGMP